MYAARQTVDETIQRALRDLQKQVRFIVFRQKRAFIARITMGGNMQTVDINGLDSDKHDFDSMEKDLQ